MNAPDSFEKQIDVAVSYDGYYPAPYSPSTTASSSCYSTSSSSNKKSLTKEETVEIVRKLYPLTMENVSKVELADPSSMPLARYCSEMGTPEAIYAPFTPSARKMLRRPQEVLESPRVLPFPYHNDSYFLPTAEHDYPGGLTATDASSSIVSLSVHTMGSRQHLSSNSTSTSLYHPHHQQRGYQRQLLSCPPKSHFYSQKRYDDDNMSNYSNKRRAVSVTPSSPSTLREETFVAPKKRRGHNKFAFKFKQNLLRFKSNNSTILETTHHCNRLQHPLSSSASIISNTLILTNDTTTTKVKQQRYESLQYNTAPVNNGPWYEKLWKLIKPTTLVKKNSKSPKTVWYSQFRCNPPPPVDINLLS